MNTRPSDPGARTSSNSARVVGEDADIREAAPGDLGDQPGDAVLEHLASDKTRSGMRLGLRREVFAGAEPDFQTHLGRARRKQRSRVERPCFGQRYRQPRQQCLMQLALARPQRSSAPPPVDPPLRRSGR